MEFSRTEYWSGYLFPSAGSLPNPEIKPRSPTFQADSLPAEPPEKPKNTGMGSLSLLQRLFLTQESNWGLLYCRQIFFLPAELLRKPCLALKIFPSGSDGKESACNVGDLGSTPGLGRSTGEGNGNPLQYFCLENPMDGGAWWVPRWGCKESDMTE